MPEGDSLRRAADRVRVLEGQVVSVETPHPRAALLGLAQRLDGKRLERVEAVGKNLLLTFEGGLVLRSHLRMKGRWHVRAEEKLTGRPWLVLRGDEWKAVQWNGPVLELRSRTPVLVRRLGPDIMDAQPDVDGMVERLRATDQDREIGEAILDQWLVAGVGNMWKAEALWLARLSPWAPLRSLSDDELRGLLEAAVGVMQAPRAGRAIYRRVGRPCRRCGEPIRSRPQGETARTAYWCAGCQAGTGMTSA
jgi:endonuclease VIII